jgi:hypothetical protein
MSWTKQVFVFIAATITAMVGHHIHGSAFWTVVDFFFWPIAIVKWLFCQEINMTVIRETFAFFFK